MTVDCLLQLFRRKRTGRPSVPLVLRVLPVLLTAIVENVALLGVPPSDDVVCLRDRDNAGGGMLVVRLRAKNQQVRLPRQLLVCAVELQKVPARYYFPAAAFYDIDD